MKALTSLARFCFAAIPLCAVVACSHAQPKANQSEVDRLVRHGYISDGRFQISTSIERRQVGDRRFEVALTTPDQGQHLPVVIYLPGLGEACTAGSAWRGAWARAGYAVLSVQPLPEDQHVLRVTDPKQRDTAVLDARERYGSAVARFRLEALSALVDALLAPGPQTDPELQRLDLRHVAVAGYDLGAWSAMLLAGERPRNDWVAPHFALPIAAVLAISPYADFSGSAFGVRYQPITAPVMSVTGDGDIDTAGVVSNAGLRRAPFEHLLVHGSALLWLSSAPHSVLAGADSEDTRLEDTQEPSHKDMAQLQRQGGGGGGGDGRRSRGAGGDGGPGGRTGPRPADAVRAPTDNRLSATDRAIDVALVQSVTVAFLDAHLKMDITAQSWLDQDLQGWLGSRAIWSQR